MKIHRYHKLLGDEAVCIMWNPEYSDGPHYDKKTRVTIELEFPDDIDVNDGFIEMSLYKLGNKMAQNLSKSLDGIYVGSMAFYKRHYQHIYIAGELSDYQKELESILDGVEEDDLFVHISINLLEEYEENWETYFDYLV